MENIQYKEGIMMDESQFKITLMENAVEYGFTITPEQADLFYNYKQILLEWNGKMNLTAITQELDIIEKHFIDSLFLLKATQLPEAATVADIGTGAGFPGIPIKIINPSIRLTLVDSLNKRITFLNEVCQQLGLLQVTTIHSRAEDFTQKAEFDCCCARAVARLNVLAEWCLPFVKVGGYFAALKGSDIDQEADEAKNAIARLGGEISEIYRYNLAKTDCKHSIVVIKKTRQTPPLYPRTAAKIAKSPLV